ncbi:MAG: hypothetical protein FJ309_05795 [Planctomycetes bacterium]|jgi:hypothetical protein|nr:hypothetical protein [Planctomycetota bacterium]
MLDREEYIEQAYLFRVLAERIAGGVAAQEALRAIGEEVLATSKLPMAIDYMVGELKLVGTLSTAMARLPHYFSAFQTFVMHEAEEESGRFDVRTALAVLEREATYRAEGATPQGLFFYRLESLSRNRLDYARGLLAVADDPLFDGDWKEWIGTVSRQVGLVDLADLVSVRSPEYWRLEKRDALLAGRPDTGPDRVILFGEREGRIARANRGKDPIYFFAALQRQLGYPAVPRPAPAGVAAESPAALARRLERLEMRVKLLEEEARGGIDLSRFDPKNLSPDSAP